MTRTLSTAPKSRRRFLKTVAMGSAAALVAATLPHAGDASPARHSRKTRPVAPVAPVAPSEIETEVAKQKKSTADILKTIRDYELPPGTEMAFVFSAAKAPRRRVTPGGTSTNGGSR